MTIELLLGVLFIVIGVAILTTRFIKINTFRWLLWHKLDLLVDRAINMVFSLIRLREKVRPKRGVE